MPEIWGLNRRDALRLAGGLRRRAARKAGVEVHAFNQRSVAQILQMITTLGALVDASDKASALVAELELTIAGVPVWRDFPAAVRRL